MSKFLSLILVLLISPVIVFSQTESPKLSKIMSNTDLSVQWFFKFIHDDAEDFNKFTLTRGYFTFKTKFDDMFSIRYTPDITQYDDGNVLVRLKYMYLKMKIGNFEILHNTFFEIGLVHRPWLDFEEHINRYRAQGTMFIERYHLINSADFGVTYAGLLGEKMDEKYQKEVNNKNAGKYGSFSFGVYNGGGYHAVEKHKNKTLEGRLTLRPFHTFMPGLQFSYNFVYGKANVDTVSADFQINIFFISFEGKNHVLALQYYSGKGSKSSKLIDPNGKSYKNDGYSAFGEFKVPDTNIFLFSRYDNFTSHQDQAEKESRIIAGAGLKFLKNKVFFDIDQHKDTNSKTTNIYELALEVHF